jgi:hypothetical protein
LQTIQESSGTPSKEAVVFRRCQRGRASYPGHFGEAARHIAYRESTTSSYGHLQRPLFFFFLALFLDLLQRFDRSIKI